MHAQGRSGSALVPSPFIKIIITTNNNNTYKMISARANERVQQGWNGGMRSVQLERLERAKYELLCVHFMHMSSRGGAKLFIRMGFFFSLWPLMANGCIH